MVSYVPKQGDVIAITFDSQSSHEQKGRRPALVVSKDLFNQSTGLAIVCPVTNTERGFPFHVPIPANSKFTGFIMVEQVKSVDFRLAIGYVAWIYGKEDGVTYGKAGIDFDTEENRSRP